MPEQLDTSYRQVVTSVEHWRSALESDDSQVRIAGVPWPTYKLVALAIGFAVLVIVGITTATASTAVLSGAAITTVLWIVLGWTTQSHN